MKLCVFPNDPLKSYLEKGEIKERYFNPNNLFDEVHVISPIEKDVNEEQEPLTFEKINIEKINIGGKRRKKRYSKRYSKKSNKVKRKKTRNKK